MSINRRLFFTMNGLTPLSIDKLNDSVSAKTLSNANLRALLASLISFKYILKLTQRVNSIEQTSPMLFSFS